MKRIYLFIFFLFAATGINAQSKQALIMTIPHSGSNTDDLVKGLKFQGFSENNLLIDTSLTSITKVNKQLSLAKERLKEGDILVIYADLKIIKNNKGRFVIDMPESSASELVFSDLLNSINELTIKLGNRGEIMLLIPEVPSDLPMDLFNKTSLIFFSGNSADHAAFSMAFFKTFSSLAENISYNGFFRQFTQRLFDISSERSVPANSSNPGNDRIFLGGHYIVAKPYYQVNPIGNRQIVINIGSKMGVFPGARVSVFNAGIISGPSVAEGEIISTENFNSTVSLDKDITGSPAGFWAIITQNGMQKSPRLKININFAVNQEEKKWHESIISSLSLLEKNGNIELVSSGGDIKITVTRTAKGMLLRLSHPVSDNLYKELEITDPKNTQPLVSFLEEVAKFEFIYKLNNETIRPGLSLQLKYASGSPISRQNGYDVIYDGDEVYPVFTNYSNKRIYFYLIDLQPDKIINKIMPADNTRLLESDLFVEPGSTRSFPNYIVKIYPPFGMERFKLFTSDMPINLNGVLFSNTKTRGSSSLYTNELIVQNYDFEIRSQAFKTGALPENSVDISLKKNAGNNIQYTLTNKAGLKLYYNVLKNNDDGTFEVILPGKGESPLNYFAEPRGENSRTFSGLKENDQLITVFADRPFNLNEYITEEKTVNDMLIDIMRYHRISGTSLSKISFAQTIYRPKDDIATRGNDDIMIKLLSPKISNERGAKTVMDAKEPTVDIAGLALSSENKKISSVSINGETVSYDSVFRSFEKTIKLAAGLNQVVIEVKNEAGFSATSILQFEFKNSVVEAGRPPRNLFLGIGIDNYKTWPRLDNAVSDVVEFSSLIKNKFDYSTQLLLDSAATRKNIINNIRNFIKTVGPGDNVIIYLSGHGNEDQLADGDYYFISQDADANDVTTAVRSTDIMDNFLKIKAKKCLLIVDACFSGMITNNVKSNNQVITSGNDKADIADLACKWVLTSGRATKVGDGEKGKHSPFAIPLLKFLQEKKDNKYLKMPFLITYLQEEVPKLRPGQQPMGMALEGQGVDIFILPPVK